MTFYVCCVNQNILVGRQVPITSSSAGITFNQWKFLDLVFDLNFFLTLTQTLTRHI